MFTDSEMKLRKERCLLLSFYDRKKKKKNKAEEIEAQATTSSPSSSRKTYSDEETNKKEFETEKGTPAEIAFQKAQEKRVRLKQQLFFNWVGSCPNRITFNLL